MQPHPPNSIPPGVFNLEDYERHAREQLPHGVYEYIAGGCGSGITLESNRSAFDRLRLCTRVLQDFSAPVTHQTLLGIDLKHPIMLAPVGHQTLVHPEGELATAQACEISDTPFIASTLSSHTLETIEEHSDGPLWFQLYWQPAREITLDLVRRAERAGYLAIVITVDTPVTGLRYRPQRAGFAMPPEICDANLTGYDAPALRLLSQHDSVIFSGFMADAPTWEDIAWLRQQTDLPLLLKGICHPADGEKARQYELQGVIVSNHGGRSLDGIPASIELLPQVRRTLGGDFPILMDGGVRRGSDVFKALALGANAVLIGRPQLFALTVAGALGVAHMLRLLKEELEITMALAGCPTLNHINQHCIY
jgi:4-hydroxymandelate oxidase